MRKKQNITSGQAANDPLYSLRNEMLDIWAQLLDFREALSVIEDKSHNHTIGNTEESFSEIYLEAKRLLWRLSQIEDSILQKRVENQAMIQRKFDKNIINFEAKKSA